MTSLKQQAVYRLSLFCLSLALTGCGGSSSGTPPAEQNVVVTPVTSPVNQSQPIEDISCSVSYPLRISAVYQEINNAQLPMLFDGNKTNRSLWQSSQLDESIIIELEEPALLKEMVISWRDLAVSHLFDVSVSKDKESWQLLVNQEHSTAGVLIPELVHLTQSSLATALYIKLTLTGSNMSLPSELVEVELFGCEQESSHDIELIDWYLSVPTDDDGNGKSDSIKETDLAQGYFDPRFFSLSKDGGLIFSTSVSGYKTSTNTKYVRSELRGMLRRGNTTYKTQGVNQNNWVFSSAPEMDLVNAGGINGKLDVEVAVNQVTSTGEDYQIGRVIIGQIHANDDEPVRLYYRKLPNNVSGAVYIAHEVLGGDDIYYEIIGSRSNSASNPTDGIGLNERFTYSIEAVGNNLTVTVTKHDGSEFSQVVDMSESGYDQGGQYMYFKAGVYNQNNSGDIHDYVRATFYQIDNSHEGYDD